MPLFKTLRQLACCAAPQRDEPVALPGRPLPLPVAAGPVAGPADPERPNRNYVEGEARKYWQAMAVSGSLNKPDREELRATALPILVMALRRRQGNAPDTALALHRTLQAVEAMQTHARMKRWIKPPYSRLAGHCGYIDALIQLADDANWLAREIPLPECQGPQHPTIYYTVNPVSNNPVPRVDALLRGDYVYTADGDRVTGDEYIHPWRDPDFWPSTKQLASWNRDTCYSLYRDGGRVKIMLHLRTSSPLFPAQVLRPPLETMIFSPPPLPPR